jgi:hypothetical protein
MSANATKRTSQRDNLEFDSACPGGTSRSATSADLLCRKHDECESARHGEKAQVVIIGPSWTYDQDISRGAW